jgi:hypothetical protein
VPQFDNSLSDLEVFFFLFRFITGFPKNFYSYPERYEKCVQNFNVKAEEKRPLEGMDGRIILK